MTPGTKQYADVSYDLARRLTLRYSSSFGLASRLFSSAIRNHIYALYGMVRVADEIVDTYDGSDKAELLAAFHADVTACLAEGYSTNPIIHAFGLTARQFTIGLDLIDPFFASMAMDLTATSFTKKEYDDYIYGSAEVIGLMCLKVFCGGDASEYERLTPGARALGSAYQKVNFLRDFAADIRDRGRIYFPGVTLNAWDDTHKHAIVADITSEFKTARATLAKLPRGARTSVYLSFLYYRAVLKKLDRMSAQQILTTRAHVPGIVKVAYLVAAPIGVRFL